jgi:hypothetical protein
MGLLMGPDFFGIFDQVHPSSSPQHLQNIGGDLYLSAEDVNGRELWKFDASEF